MLAGAFRVPYLKNRCFGTEAAGYVSYPAVFLTDVRRTAGKMRSQLLGYGAEERQKAPGAVYPHPAPVVLAGNYFMLRS